MSPRRVSTLARERGIAFDLNPETENQLKNAGADTILLDDLRKLRAERAKQNQPSDNQRTEGAKEITAALTALRDWLSYTIANTPQGRFWDPSGEIRADISRGLRAATASRAIGMPSSPAPNRWVTSWKRKAIALGVTKPTISSGGAVNHVRIASPVKSFSSRFAGLDFSLRHRLFWFSRSR